MFKQKITLLQLLSGLMIASTILIFGSGLAVSYNVTNKEFVSQSLDTNKMYASKLADTADLYLEEMMQLLQFSAYKIAQNYTDEETRQNELDRLANQLRSFNSLTVLTKDYEVLHTSINNSHLKGSTLQTETAKEAIAAQKPFISTPFETVTNKLGIFLSHPIFHEDGRYLGVVGGTIYLKENNALRTILGAHYYRDGSFVYVIDREGFILYHDDFEKIGSKVTNETIVHRISEYRSGASQIKGDDGKRSIAGYASIQKANWGVVSERPYAQVTAPATHVLKRTALSSLPFIIISLLVILLTAKFITKPLRSLATLVEQTSKNTSAEKMKNVNDWYYEAHQMKLSIMKSIGSFQEQVSYYHTKSVVDPLTGLTNRRTMDDLLDRWIEEKSAFVLLILDLDHFKSVNDTYGHAVGDDVLRYLANMMTDLVEGEDEICCRYGGEEFVILFKNKPLPYVIEKAETLRQQLEETDSPTGHPITMSAGIGAFPLHTSAPAELFELVDEALYESKRTGRNRVTVVTERDQ